MAASHCHRPRASRRQGVAQHESASSGTGGAAGEGAASGTDGAAGEGAASGTGGAAGEGTTPLAGSGEDGSSGAAGEGTAALPRLAASNSVCAPPCLLAAAAGTSGVADSVSTCSVGEEADLTGGGERVALTDVAKGRALCDSAPPCSTGAMPTSMSTGEKVALTEVAEGRSLYDSAPPCSTGVMPDSMGVGGKMALTEVAEGINAPAFAAGWRVGGKAEVGGEATRRGGGEPAFGRHVLIVGPVCG